nr:BON domain-containing protein [Rhizobium sp. BK491]
MTKISDRSNARGSPRRGDTRTVQALDQAAGGSGDIESEQRAGEASPIELRPENGTDDARCEDSATHDLLRRQMADEVSGKISEVRAASGSEEASGDTRSEPPYASTPERTDVEIRTEIESRLKADQLLDETSIFVTVSHGRVVIEGSVENHEAKQRAEALSRQAGGIIGHDSNLAVRKSQRA